VLIDHVLWHKKISAIDKARGTIDARQLDIFSSQLVYGHVVREFMPQPLTRLGAQVISEFLTKTATRHDPLHDILSSLRPS
jgi:hypothetical protein